MRTTTRITALAVTAGLLCTGCATAAGTDKAGGEADAVTLRFANPYAHLDYVPQVEAFVHRVEEVSGGAIAIEVLDEWRSFEPGFESGTIADVAAGDVDLAWVGTRSFDLVGETALRALTAPFLVDSEELEQAIIDSGLSDEMMDAVDIDGLEPLAILAGGLRRPFSVDSPLTDLAAFQGIRFESLGSRLNSAATKALGAEPAHQVSDGLDAGLADGSIQGFEKQFSTVLINGTSRLAPYVAANVVLWPETIVIVGNADRLGGLSERQRGWLEEATHDAATSSVANLPDDVEGFATFCAAGGRAGLATDSELTELRAAVEPVVTMLRSDAVTSRFIDEIAELKTTIDAAALEVPTECTGVAASKPAASTDTDAATRAIEGVYRWELTAEAADAAGRREDPRYPWPHVFTMTLEDGAWSHTVRDAKQTGDYGGGPYEVNGDELLMTWDDSGAEMRFTFTKLEDGSLELAPTAGTIAEDAFVIASQTWQRIE